MSNGLTRYVMGLMLSPDLLNVVLLRKNRPAFLAGLLNGVGGKIEPGESPVFAMSREFKEEADLDVAQSAWISLGHSTGPGYEIFFFYTLDSRYNQVRTMTDEPVQPYPRAMLGPDVHYEIFEMLAFIDKAVSTGSDGADQKSENSVEVR